MEGYLIVVILDCCEANRKALGASPHPPTVGTEAVPDGAPSLLEGIVLGELGREVDGLRLEL